MTSTTTTPIVVVRRSARVASRAAAAATTTTSSVSSGGNSKAKKNKKKTSETHGHIKSTPAKKKLKHTGLQGSTIDSSAPLGVVDPASNITNGSIMTLDDGAPADVMLVLVDPAKNNDKYFVLQCIVRGSSSSSSSSSGTNNNNDNNIIDYCVYSRWGRTGTSGQALQQDFDDAAAAIQAFEDKFCQKTGLTWTERNEPYQGGKYRFITQDFVQKLNGYANGRWQYYVDDGVDGKVTGWYDYDANGSMQVEILFHQNVHNPQLSQRHVASGNFTYHVDLDNMTQTNTSHPARKTRRIRRVVVNHSNEEEVAAGGTEEGKEEDEEVEPESTTNAPASVVAATTATTDGDEVPVPLSTTTTTSEAVGMTTPPRPRRGATAPTPMVSPSPARS